MAVQRPETDGPGARRRSNERWPNGGRRRIIAMTVNAMPGAREHCRAAGRDDEVTQPNRVNR